MNLSKYIELSWKIILIVSWCCKLIYNHATFYLLMKSLACKKSVYATIRLS